MNALSDRVLSAAELRALQSRSDARGATRLAIHVTLLGGTGWLIAIASGFLVTKATSKASLGQELGTQFMSNPRPLAMGAGILLCLASVPGLPKLPFLVLALGLWRAMRWAQSPANNPPPRDRNRA